MEPSTVESTTIDILNLSLTFVNLCVFIYFTKLVYDYNKSKDKIDFLRQVPLVSIEQKDDCNYYIKNVGSGPAINIRILSEPDFENRTWNKNEIGYSLFGDSTEIELNPFDKSAYLILYSDIHQKNYFSYMKNNILSFGSLEDSKSNDKIHKILKFKRPAEEFRRNHIPSV
ncbi:hypothetical protein [Flavobacterium sp.]|uniref:hypothetical protein n=1 Tax=Flavobacterium sp. TaxID=239 RepID=UPI003D6C1A22